MSTGPYDKAVQGFEAILAASTNGLHAKPVQLIKDSGHHLTSGYRHTATLEAEGVLRRDESGVYMQGAAALRTALSGFGFGRLAPVIPAVLRRLREETQHTAFLAMLDDTHVHMGPHSVGRASRDTALVAVYRHDLTGGLPADRPVEAGLAPTNVETGGRIHTVLMSLAGTAEYTAALGFAVDPGRALNPALPEALAQAARQIVP